MNYKGIDAAVEVARGEQVVRLIVARHGPWRRGQSAFVSGVMACPVCKTPEALEYSRAAHNGHLAARCVLVCGVIL